MLVSLFVNKESSRVEQFDKIFVNQLVDIYLKLIEVNKKFINNITKLNTIFIKNNVIRISET